MKAIWRGYTTYFPGSDLILEPGKTYELEIENGFIKVKDPEKKYEANLVYFSKENFMRYWKLFDN